MKESIIKLYFEDEIGVLSLKAFLGSIRGKSELRQGYDLVCDLVEDYTVSLACLSKICKDYLNGELESIDVEAIAFFLMGADHFEWDSDTPEGSVISQIVDDWSTPEVAFPINQKNMKIIARSLIEGVYDPKMLSKHT